MAQCASREGDASIPAFEWPLNVDGCKEDVPVETTICKFRHLLEQHKLAEQLFATSR